MKNRARAQEINKKISEMYDENQTLIQKKTGTREMPELKKAAKVIVGMIDLYKNYINLFDDDELTPFEEEDKEKIAARNKMAGCYFDLAGVRYEQYKINKGINNNSTQKLDNDLTYLLSNIDNLHNSHHAYVATEKRHGPDQLSVCLGLFHAWDELGDYAMDCQTYDKAITAYKNACSYIERNILYHENYTTSDETGIPIKREILQPISKEQAVWYVNWYLKLCYAKSKINSEEKLTGEDLKTITKLLQHTGDQTTLLLKALANNGYKITVAPVAETKATVVMPGHKRKMSAAQLPEKCYSFTPTSTSVLQTLMTTLPRMRVPSKPSFDMTVIQATVPDAFSGCLILNIDDMVTQKEKYKSLMAMAEENNIYVGIIVPEDVRYLRQFYSEMGDEPYHFVVYTHKPVVNEVFLSILDHVKTTYFPDFSDKEQLTKIALVDPSVEVVRLIKAKGYYAVKTDAEGLYLKNLARFLKGEKPLLSSEIRMTKRFGEEDTLNKDYKAFSVESRAFRR